MTAGEALEVEMGVPPLSDLEIHPAAELFPLIEGPEFDALVQDIEEHGQLEAVVFTPEGLLLDGRNRWRALVKAGITPVTRVHEGDPWAYVISANVHRRHLTTSQRGMIAARITARVRSGLPNSQYHELQPTAAQAAKMLNLSGSTITSARRVLDAGTDALISAVQDGSLPVHTAERVVRQLGVDEQAEYMEKFRMGANPKRLASQMGAASEHEVRFHDRPVGNLHPRRHSTITRRHLETLGASLHALETVLTDAEALDPSITSEEAARWVRDLSAGRVQLSRVLKILTEHKESSE